MHKLTLLSETCFLAFPTLIAKPLLTIPLPEFVPHLLPCPVLTLITMSRECLREVRCPSAFPRISPWPEEYSWLYWPIFATRTRRMIGSSRKLHGRALASLLNRSALIPLSSGEAMKKLAAISWTKFSAK